MTDDKYASQSRGESYGIIFVVFEKRALCRFRRRRNGELVAEIELVGLITTRGDFDDATTVDEIHVGPDGTLVEFRLSDGRHRSNRRRAKLVARRRVARVTR